MTYKDIAIIRLVMCPVCFAHRGKRCFMSNPRSLVKMHRERRKKAEQIRRDDR